MLSTHEIDTLRTQGYSVEPSKSQAGKFRWWRETGSDGVSVHAFCSALNRRTSTSKYARLVRIT
jgi:hypothetical protein